MWQIVISVDVDASLFEKTFFKYFFLRAVFRQMQVSERIL